MAGKNNPNNGKYKCVVCGTTELNGPAYINHIQSKRHIKNLKDRNRPQPNDEDKRTIQVSGFVKNAPLDEIIYVFLKYGVRMATRQQNVIAIEFQTAEGAKNALENANRWRDTLLKTSRAATNNHNKGLHSVPISRQMWNHLQRLVTDSDLERLVAELITEIEIKPREYETREYLRKIMVRFLMPHFNRTFAYIFGSSANNLGFTGCDVDLYVDLGVYPWDSGYSRNEAQTYAANLTWFLARNIRNSRRGVQVEAVPRARVPIVKFKETSTGMFVDLSFRNGMPVFNTKLIHQYTRTHHLVRPYMMVIRCWAKIQNVGGSGEPSSLITNYALSLMMLFYLMYRDPPIIPSVAFLKENLPNNNNSGIINGWDCNFSNNVMEWSRQYHKTSTMELVADFFEYFGNLDADKWLLSPYAGTMIDKVHIKDRDMRKLAPCMLPYCQQDTDIQMNTALCVQDVFELSHNCTRGLKWGPLAEFQYKCKKAAEISREVTEGNQSLSDFLQVIEMTPEVLDELAKKNPAEEKKKPPVTSIKRIVSEAVQKVEEESIGNVELLQEVITLDESQDSVIMLDDSIGEKPISPFKGKEDFVPLDKTNGNETKENDSDTSGTKCSSLDRPLIAEAKINDNSNKLEIAASSSSKSYTSGNDFVPLGAGVSGVLAKNKKEIKSDIEFITDICRDDDDISVVGEIKKENGALESCSSELNGPRDYLASEPLNRPLKQILKFEDVPEFSITYDGSVSGNSNVIMTSQDDLGQAACSLIHFVLQQCLKMEVSVIEDVLGGKKRKNPESEEDADSSKRQKVENGECVAVPVEYRRLAQYKCETDIPLWMGRKKIAKKLPRQAVSSPLQYELAITEVQLARGNFQKGIVIDCLIEVWQKCEDSSLIMVTGKLLSQDKTATGHSTTMFAYLTSLVQNLLKKVIQYLQLTSSKR